MITAEALPLSERREQLTVMAPRHARAAVRHSAWEVLRYQDFRLYFLGSLTSNLGTWMQTTAQVVLVYQLTHAVFAVGLVTSAQFAGSLFLGPSAAAVASRMGGKRMLTVTQLASAGVAALLAMLGAAGSLGENGLIAGALVMGLLFTFALPVQTALVPRLVPRNQRDAEAAIAMNSVSYNAGRALAPALCVMVIVTIGFKWAFAINAISFLVYAVTLAWVRPRSSDEPAPPARVRDAGRVALETPRILLLLAMVAALTLADDPVLILGPALAHQLHTSSSWSGYFLSALGLGAVLGSVWPTRSPRSWSESQTSRRAAWSLLLLAIAVVVFSVGITAWISLAAAFAAGVAALRTGAVTQTQLIRLRPGYAAGVMALWAICWAGSKPLASLVDGGLASVAPHLWIAAAALALPAVLLAVAEIFLSQASREMVRSWASLTSTQLSAWLRRGLALAGNGDAAERVVGELAEFLRGQHVAPVAAGLIGFVARVTGDPARYGDEFRSELWELADGGKGPWGQLAYALRQLVAAGALRMEANSPRGRETSP